MDQQTRNDRNKRKQLLITGLALVFCLGIFAVYQVKQTSVPSDVGPANKIQTTVDVFTVAKADLVKRISLSGQTVPTAEVDIAAKYQGRITGVYVSLGQRVTAGQALVVQDTGDADIAVLENQAAYRQAVAEAQTSAVSFQAAYDRAKADYQRALASYQRYKSLYDMGGISREAFDINSQQLADAKATLDTLANQINSGSEPATVEAARAAAAKAGQAVSAAQKERGDLVLSSPRSGVIGYRMVEVGDLVQAGQKLLSIVDNSNIYVDCQVSEQDMAAMSLGMKVDVQIESLGKSIPGKIIYISPANDPQNLSFSLRIALTSSDPSIRSGVYLSHPPD